MQNLIDDYEATRVQMGLPRTCQGATDRYQWCEHVTLHLILTGARNGSEAEKKLLQDWADEASQAKRTRMMLLRQ